MASTVEAQTAEEAKSFSKTHSYDRKPIIDLQMPVSQNLADNRNINQFQRLMRGHGAAKMRHTYTLRLFAKDMLCQITYKYNIYMSTVHCPVLGTGTSRSGPGLNVCWLIKDRLRRSYKAQLPQKQFRKWLCVDDRSEISCTSVLTLVN